MNTLATSKALNLGVLANLSNIENYISTVLRLPMLSREDEIRLATRWRDHQDINAAHEMVLSHLRLVVSVSREFLGYNLPQADLIQEGNIGLMKAAKGFDPDRGFRFTTYAIQWIKAEIKDYVIKNWRLVKMATTKPQRKLFFNLRSKHNSYDTMTEQQIADMAQDLNVPARDVKEMEMRLSGNEFAFDMPLTNNNDGTEYDSNDAIMGTLDTEPTHMLALDAAREYSTSGISDALTRLDERELRIVKARWLDGDEGALLSFRELGEELGVSTQRVQQIEKVAIKKLKAAMGKHADEAFVN